MAYTRALLAGPTELKSEAAYNLGNARFRQGDFGPARDAYTRALQGDPSDADAKRNLELALRALQQQQQQQDDPSDSQDQQDQQQQQQQQDQNGEQENQPEQGEDEQQQQPSSQDSENPPPSEQPSPQPADGEMTTEQAERLLDSAAEDEKESLQRRMRAKRRATRLREKDW